MSEENVEIVRRLIDAWNRQDIEGTLALADPAVEYVNFPTAVEPGTRQGHDGLTAVFRAQWEMLSGARLEIERIYDRGDEIILLGRVSRRMPESEDRIEAKTLFSWTLRDGKVIRGEGLGLGLAEVQAALEAAGLSE